MMKTKDSKLLRLEVYGDGHSGITKNFYQDVTLPNTFVLDVHKSVKGSSDVNLPGKILMASKEIIRRSGPRIKPTLKIEATGEYAQQFEAWVNDLMPRFPELRLEYVFVGYDQLKRHIIDPIEYIS